MMVSIEWAVYKLLQRLMTKVIPEIDVEDPKVENLLPLLVARGSGHFLGS